MPILVSELFAYQHHDVAAGGPGMAQEVDAGADAILRLAVVAHTVFAARSIDVKPLRVGGTCRSAGTC